MRFGLGIRNGGGRDLQALYTQASYRGNNPDRQVKPKKVTQKSKKKRK